MDALLNTKRHKIMVIDDDASSLTLLRGILKGHYDVSLAASGRQALKYIRNVSPSLIILDLGMPDMDGYEVLREIKKSGDIDIPVVILTGAQEIESEIRALEMGAVDYIHKPVVATLVLSRIKLHLELEDYRLELERRVEERTAALIYQQGATIDVLAYATDCRDNTTGEHLYRTRKCVELLLENIPAEHGGYDIPEATARDIALASALHDLGKVTIPDAILLKPGKLTSAEFEEMKTHAARGAEMLERLVPRLDSAWLLDTAREIAIGHHEKWDGSGYPHKLSGREIPLSARVMAIADVYDALRTKRPYKEPFDAVQAYSIILEGNGTHFDPVLVEAFIRLPEKLEHLYQGAA